MKNGLDSLQIFLFVTFFLFASLYFLQKLRFLQSIYVHKLQPTARKLQVLEKNKYFLRET